MIIDTPEPGSATGDAARMLDDDLRRYGTVFAHTRAMAVNPEAYAATMALVRALLPSIGLRVFELATLGAAGALGSGHCLLAHGRRSLDAGVLSDDQLGRFAADHRDAQLSDAEIAVVDYARRMSTDARSMTDADTQSLRDAGYSDRQIVDITLAAGMRNMLSRTFQALAVPLEPMPGLSPQTAAALVAAAER